MASNAPVRRAAAVGAALLFAAALSPASLSDTAWGVSGTTRTVISAMGRVSRDSFPETMDLAFDGSGGWTLDWTSDEISPTLGGTVVEGRRGRFVLVADQESSEDYQAALTSALADLGISVLEYRDWRANIRGRAGETDDGPAMRLQVKIRGHMTVSYMERVLRLSVTAAGRYGGTPAP